MFHCPTTGYAVQGLANDLKPGQQPHTYEPVRCVACRGSHFVDPTSGDVMGESKDARPKSNDGRIERRAPLPGASGQRQRCLMLHSLPFGGGRGGPCVRPQTQNRSSPELCSRIDYGPAPGTFKITQV